MGNVFVDTSGETRRRLADELRLAASSAAGRQFRGSLLASAEALASMGSIQGSVGLVLGEELGDGAQATWVVCAYERQTLAQDLATRLNDLALAYGRSIGNEALVGLAHEQRRELESHARELDRQVKVGRHGVRWYVVKTVLNPG